MPTSNVDPKDDTLPALPVTGTSAAASYYSTFGRNISLFHFLLDTVLTGDYVAHVAKVALDETGSLKKIDTPADLARQQPGSRTKYLRQYTQPLLEMFFVRDIDNFEKYLVDLVRIVLKARPDLLKSSKKSLTLEEILNYKQIDDLVNDIVEKRVSELSYEGFSALKEWCEERGISIPINNMEVEVVIEWIATRNIIAHNRGLVDRRYLRVTNSTKFKLNDQRTLQLDQDLFAAQKLLHSIVGKMDAEAANKFNLPTHPIAIKPGQPDDARNPQSAAQPNDP